uniref:Uncharacterized protein n=1 Tax=Arundo donax TaxID=35708 RepID=A0A0A9BXC9_ARUDO
MPSRLPYQSIYSFYLNVFKLVVRGIAEIRVTYLCCDGVLPMLKSSCKGC